MAKRDRSTPKDAEVREQVKNAEQGFYYINARAGTGKTDILAERVVCALLNNKQPKNMMCITFTNGAADEMRSRIIKFLQKEGYNHLEKKAEDVFIGNIHKFCLRFLMSNAECIRKMKDENLYPYKIIDDRHLKSFVNHEGKGDIVYERAVFGGEAGTVTIDEVRKFATYLRQKQESHPDEVNVWKRYAADLKEAKRDKLEKYSYRYIIYKKKHGLCDFDDILIDAYSRLTESDARKKYPELSSFSWIQVDEMQDLNPLEHGIISKLVADENSTVCYFGDQNQAIYSFQGATYDQLKTFQDDKKYNKLTFTENFRSPDCLVKVFDRYVEYELEHHGDRYEELKPQSRIRPLGRLHIHNYATTDDERKGIAEAVDGIWKYNSACYRATERRHEAAILVRTGEEANMMSLYLKEKKIPHLNVSGFDALQRDAIRVLLSHFSVVCDEFDYDDWARILRHLHCGSCDDDSYRIAAEDLHRLGFIPSDFILYGDSSYLRKFYEAAKGDSVVYSLSRDEIHAVRLSGGKVAGPMFTGRVGAETFQKNFMKFIGEAAVFGFKNEDEISYLQSKLPGKDDSDSKQDEGKRPWNLKKTARLLNKNKYSEVSLSALTDELPDCESLPSGAPKELMQTVSLFRHHISRAEELLPRQEAYLSHLGTQYLARKLHDVYGPVYRHTKNLLDGKTLPKKESRKKKANEESGTKKKDKSPGQKLADEFRWVYKALKKKKIIHNVNPWLVDKKNREHEADIAIMAHGGRINEKEANLKWENIFNEDMDQTERKTEYFFKYLQRSVFKEGTGCGIRALLKTRLQGIRYISESDLLHQSFVKEPVCIMTVHKAKGHEFTDVFIPGASGRTYPFYSHKRDWEIEEDKRLFYVALTRSRNNITISYTESYHNPCNKRRNTTVITPFVKCIRSFFHTQQKRKAEKNGKPRESI